MKKTIATAAAAGALLLSAMPVFAGKPTVIPPVEPQAYRGLNNPGNYEHLYLYEKDVTGDWSIVDGGAFGQMMFDADSFMFNGHGLLPSTGYTLIRYTDPWPGNPVCLGSGTSNGGGNLKLTGEMLAGGSKVWLVLSSDVNCGVGMTGWNPAEYLFEYNEI